MKHPLLRQAAGGVLALLLLTGVMALYRKLAGDPVPSWTPFDGRIAENEEERPDAAFVYHGAEYVRKAGVSACLFMGIDKPGDVESAPDNLGGQSDALMLLVLNEEDERFTVVQIDRDTVATIDLLDRHGERTGFTSVTPICLSHTYGTGDEKCCENTVRAVSRLLYDIPVDGYVSLMMEGIPVLNDLLGGIRFRIEDDFPESDAAFVPGETAELRGDAALRFVRGRMDVGDGTNAGRMRRQRTYLDAFFDRLTEEMRGNSAIVNDLYRAAGPYMVTDMSAGKVSAVAAKLFTMENGGIVVPSGVSETVQRKGRTYEQFRADEEDLMRIVRELFYEPIREDSSGGSQNGH